MALASTPTAKISTEKTIALQKISFVTKNWMLFYIIYTKDEACRKD
jgi:hypothetical protein